MRQLKKKINNLQKNKFEDMGKCDLNDSKFKITILNKLNKIQEKNI